MPFRMLTSLYGRRIGLSSTGGLGSGYTSTGGQYASTAGQLGAIAQLWGDSMVTTTSATGVTLSNNGVAILNTTSTAGTYLVSAPVVGVSKEIYIISSASALTFGGTSTSQVFMKIGAGTAGSTTVTLTDANLAGQVLLLRGLSATQWGIVNGSTVIQA